MPHLIGRKIRNGYVITRGISALLAIIFSLYYSKSLGVEKRSLVTFMLVVAVIMATVLTSGVGLAFRKFAHSEPHLVSLSSYLFINLALAILVSISSAGILMFYSRTQVFIPTTLLYLAIIYSFLGALDFSYHQGLIAYGLFKIAAVLDLLTITIQILTFLLLTFSNQVSIAVSLFTSLIISYITSTVSSALILLVHTNSSLMPTSKGIVLLLRKSAPYHIVGIANGFADRIDRIIIAWFLPLGMLGKYAVGTSLLSYLRFLPEAFSRLIVGGQTNFAEIAFRRIGASWIVRLFFGLTLSSILAFASQTLVRVILGREWLLPFIIILAFAIQELVRGYFQLRIATLVTQGRESNVMKISILLIAMSALFSLIGVNLVGLIGVPIGIGLTYLILLYFSYKIHWKSH